MFSFGLSVPDQAWPSSPPFLVSVYHRIEIANPSSFCPSAELCALVDTHGLSDSSLIQFRRHRSSANVHDKSVPDYKMLGRISGNCGMSWCQVYGC